MHFYGASTLGVDLSNNPILSPSNKRY